MLTIIKYGYNLTLKKLIQVKYNKKNYGANSYIFGNNFSCIKKKNIMNIKS